MNARLIIKQLMFLVNNLDDDVPLLLKIRDECGVVTRTVSLDGYYMSPSGYFCLEIEEVPGLTFKEPNDNTTAI